MSFRRDPRTVPEILASMQEQLRRVSTATVVNASEDSLAGLAVARGDILVARGAGDVSRLAVGPDGDVLTANSRAPQGVDWEPNEGLLLAWLAL